MKTFKSILIIFLVVAITVAVMKSFDKKAEAPVVEEETFEIDLSPEINAKQVCYIWNTEAGDRALLSMDVRGENVIGEFYWLPAEKDKKTGIFKGTFRSLSIDPNKFAVDAIWDTNAEGMTAREQLWIMISGSIANPGFGAMKDRGDGVYVYADPENVSYGLNLQQTDCGDEVMD